MISHTGPPGTAEKDLAPLRSFGPPVLDFVEETTWADLNCSMDDPPGFRNYMTSDYLVDLTDDAIDVIDRHAHRLPRGPGWVGVFCWGGAVTRPPSPTPLGTAMPAGWCTQALFGRTRRRRERCREWVGRFVATCALTPPAPVAELDRGRG